jgi:hypothetical protein
VSPVDQVYSYVLNVLHARRVVFICSPYTLFLTFCPLLNIYRETTESWVETLKSPHQTQIPHLTSEVSVDGVCSLLQLFCLWCKKIVLICEDELALFMVNLGRVWLICRVLCPTLLCIAEVSSYSFLNPGPEMRHLPLRELLMLERTWVELNSLIRFGHLWHSWDIFLCSVVCHVLHSCFDSLNMLSIACFACSALCSLPCDLSARHGYFSPCCRKRAHWDWAVI